ncbi:MAG: polysaccharide deacetylase family protein [Solirubrobacterales bacterium]|nr:polysaccharide deacetylase family protein [Solirubrobacterales bacterium]
MTGPLAETPARRRGGVRRRRAVALVTLVVLMVFGVVAAAAGGGGSSRPAARLPRPPVTIARRRTGRSLGPSLAARENAAITRLERRQPFIRIGGSQRREIALTFDDGPGPYTPRILDALARVHAPATFFEIGFMIHYFNDSLRRELRMGMAIGDHTETHPMMAALSPAGQRAEIVDQTEHLRRYGGPFPRLYRPPYGSYDQTTLALLRKLRMLMVLWTVDTSDFLQPGVGAIVHRTMAGARPGAIILMHDAGGTRTQEIAAVPIIVNALRARGYTLVTVPRLILDDPPPHAESLPRRLSGD